jgi:hypothetical protein
MSKTLIFTVVVLLLAASPAGADNASPDVGVSFRAFCSSWMAKLDQRRQENARRAEPVPDGDRVAIEYTAYSPEPVACHARKREGATSAVGQLVYQELRVRATGTTAAKARAAVPNVVSKTDIVEIFRFDGRRWRY